MPALPPKEQHGRCFHDYQMQQMDQYAKRVKRSKSTSAMDTIFLESLHMLKAKGRDGVVTLGYQTITMDGISPMDCSSPEQAATPDLYVTDDFTKNPEEDEFMIIG